jgi:DNA-binding SARP family transcriptional activator
MLDLRLFFFGSPHIVCSGQPLRVDTRKATALMAYLAVTGRPCRRETLIALLWPESDNVHGHGVLRRTLSVLNKALDGKGLAISRESIGLSGEAWCDVSEFHRLLATRRSENPHNNLARLNAATALYRDDFLNGFGLVDSLTFDDWQIEQAEQLRGELSRALEWLAQGYAAQGKIEAALEAARRWLALDRLNEAAHCQLMCLYAWAGQRSAALRQYAECSDLLRKQINAEPQAETTALYTAIKENRLPAAPASPRLNRKKTPAGAPALARHPTEARTVQLAVNRQPHGPREADEASQKLALTPILHWWWHH